MTASETIRPRVISRLARIFWRRPATRHDEPCLRERSCRQQEDLGQCDPLDLPGTGCSLVVFDHGIEQGGDVLTDQRGQRRNINGRNRVALLRHRARRTPAFVERLVNLLHLGLHHQFDVQGDLSADAGDKTEKAANFGDAVAHRVPGDLRLTEPQLNHQGFLDFQPILAERR